MILTLFVATYYEERSINDINHIMFTLLNTNAIVANSLKCKRKTETLIDFLNLIYCWYVAYLMRLFHSRSNAAVKIRPHLLTHEIDWDKKLSKWTIVFFLSKLQSLWLFIFHRILNLPIRLFFQMLLFIWHNLSIICP